MTKKHLKYFVFLLLLSLAGWLVFKTSERVKTNKQVKARRQQLPNFTVYTIDSTQFTSTGLKSDWPTVIVYFNSECEHCQYEVRELKKHADAFAHVNLLMVSTEKLSQIRAFSQRYGLEKLALSHISEKDMYHAYGSVPIPSLFIYNAERKLVKHFKGETKIEAVIQLIRHVN